MTCLHVQGVCVRHHSRLNVREESERWQVENCQFSPNPSSFLPGHTFTQLEPPFPSIPFSQVWPHHASIRRTNNFYSLVYQEVLATGSLSPVGWSVDVAVTPHQPRRQGQHPRNRQSNKEEAIWAHMPLGHRPSHPLWTVTQETDKRRSGLTHCILKFLLQQLSLYPNQYHGY